MSLSPDTLIIPPYKFLPGSSYNISLSVTDINKNVINDEIQVFVIPSDIVVVFNRASGTVPIAADFFISASSSFDPDQPSSVFQFN